jgi:hypothetical protein
MAEEPIDREKLAGCFITINKASPEGWAAMLVGLGNSAKLIEFADDPIAAVVRLARRLQTTPATEEAQQ